MVIVSHYHTLLVRPAVASSVFVIFFPCDPGGPMFSVRVVSLSWLVPIWKRQELAFRPRMT
jgi:hypothetical protein